MRSRSDSPTKFCTLDGCDRPLRARGLCQTHYNLSHYTRQERHPKVEQQCSACGAPVVKEKSWRYRVVCSQRCRYFITNGRWPETGREIVGPIAIEKPTDPGITVIPSTAIWVMGWCQRCGTSFVIRDQRTNRHCSKVCAKADGRDRRNAVKREAFVENVYRKRIYERDGWRCQLCRKKVNRNAVVPHPKAPTLDHILPLSLGGTHEPANVQLACFMCNAIKSHGLYLNQPEQLRLLGA